MTEFKRNEDGIIELPKQYDYEEVNNVYRVSNHTARYIELYQKVQDLWGEIYSLVETEYVYEKPNTLDDFLISTMVRTCWKSLMRLQREQETALWNV